MRTNDIKKLIESFYNGETSQSEDLLLLNYFKHGEVAKELLEERALFLQFYEKESLGVPRSLESDLNNLIDNLSGEDEKKKKKPVKHMLLWSGVAASIAILLAAGIYFDNTLLEGNNKTLVEIQQEQNTLKVTDVEFIEAENAMRLLSSNFSKGMEQIDQMNEELKKTNRTLEEALKQ